MEILSSKYRSPPPKPPRRRYSDQLSVSQSGGKKINDGSKVIEREIHLKTGKDTKCGSLPANWISGYSSDNNLESSLENSLYNTSSPLPFLTPIRCTSRDFQLPNSSTSKIESQLLDATSGNKYSFGNPEWTESTDLSFFENILKSSMVASVDVPRQFLASTYDEKTEGAVLNMIGDKSLSNEYHRRHHSDPVFLNLDGINLKNDTQNSILKSHSSLETASLDSYDRLCNSSTAECEMKGANCLQEEIKNLKEVNNKLWKHLCTAQANLEKSKRNSEETICALSISDLLSSLYYSQKAKDSAMEDRMKIVLNERDAAVQELQNIIQVISRSFKDDIIEEKVMDIEIKNLLKEIERTFNPAKLLQQQRLLLMHLYHSKELKQDHVMHELKLAVKEKDHLTEKVKCLEEELKGLKICNELLNSDNKHWENNLLNLICQVIQQRDSALSKTNKSQTSEQTNSRSLNEKEWSVEPLKRDSTTFLKYENLDLPAVKRNSLSSQQEIRNCDSHSIESSSDDIRLLKRKVFVLSRALEIEVENREIAEEKCLKLERLINVLQRKVNGQNVGIAV